MPWPLDNFCCTSLSTSLIRNIFFNVWCDRLTSFILPSITEPSSLEESMPLIPAMSIMSSSFEFQMLVCDGICDIHNAVLEALLFHGVSLCYLLFILNFIFSTFTSLTLMERLAVVSQWLACGEHFCAGKSGDVEWILSHAPWAPLRPL